MLNLSPLWGSDIAPNSNDTAWLWHGFLAPHNLTLLTSLWKSGKTTLISHLLHRRAQGGQLLGRDVRPGGTVIVTEEPKSLWAMRARRLDFGQRVCFLFRPFATRPDLPTWSAFLDRLLELQDRHGIDLVVFDPLVVFMPANENSGPALLKALQELQRLTERGLAVLLLHHPPKGEPKLGQAARGSGVLPAFADVLLEMRVPAGDPATRRRNLHGFSRYTETPQHLHFELNSSRDDYTLLAADAANDTLMPAFETLQALLLQSPTPLTRDEIHHAWQPHEPPPNKTTLWRCLTRACTLGLLQRTGAGSRTDPYRYSVPNANPEQLS